MPGRYFPTNTGTRTVRTITTTKRNTLPKVFDCLFCNSQQSVRVSLDRKHKIGSLRCNKCANNFQCKILHIECEVDVHAKWIDACEEVAKQEMEKEDNKRKEAEAGKEKGQKKRKSRDEGGDIRGVAKRYHVSG